MIDILHFYAAIHLSSRELGSGLCCTAPTDSWTHLKSSRSQLMSVDLVHELNNDILNINDV